jgi:hypothetical protein
LLTLFLCCIHTFTSTPFVFSVSYFVSHRPEGPFLIQFTWILYILWYLCLGGRDRDAFELQCWLAQGIEHWTGEESVSLPLLMHEVHL